MAQTSPLDYITAAQQATLKTPIINKTDAQVQAETESADNALKALEQRYANPNWFNVAAGFFKPQLGGFAASLGSAAQVLGENVEQQRANELPIYAARAQVGMLKGQMANRQTAAKEFEAERAKGFVDTNMPALIARLGSLGAAPELVDAAKEALAARSSIAGTQSTKVGTAIQATEAMGKDPMLMLQDYTRLQLQPDVDPAQLEAKQKQVFANVAASKPPQVAQEQWNAMSRYDQMASASKYAEAQLEKGMSTEDKLRQQANTAPERLGLLGSIRDLALGAGIPDSKDADGKTINGQQQMGSLLNKFGGNNPMEVFARAMADGKGPALLQDIDVYARQAGMSEEAKNKFQVLVKLLAENQVTLRGGALNPTDAFGQLQTMASPNVGNSQNALVTLTDLMSHSEKHNQEKYNYAKDAKKPYGELERDIGFNELRSKYAKEHARIAASNPLMAAPESYNPSSGNVSAKPAAPAAPASQQRSNERTINGQVWVRQPDGSYKPKAP
jgi:hypothetical protein